MAATPITGPSSRPEIAVPPVIIPLGAYAADHDSAEQGVTGPVDEMQPQSQARRRLQNEQTGSTSHEHENLSTVPEATAESDSSDGVRPLGGEKYGTIAVYHEALLIPVIARSAAWRRLFKARVTEEPLSHSGADEDNTRRDRGYGDFEQMSRMYEY